MARRTVEKDSAAVWDTETTGLILHPDAPLDKQPRIVELALVRLSRKDGKVLKRNSWLVNPLCPIPPDASRIHGITDEAVRDQPTFPELWPKIRAEFLKCETAIAHNSPFDVAVLTHELRRNALAPIDCRHIDTIGLYREEWGFDPKLTQLFEAVTGKTFDQKHRAAGDVDALIEIVQAGELWRL